MQLDSMCEIGKVHTDDGGPPPTLSIIVPAYNEEQVLLECHRRIVSVVDSLELATEIIYVNDGSTDGTLSVLKRLRETDPRIGLIDLSRNYGKEIALTAGLDHARGDAVIVTDADLQDPPELIPDLLDEWRRGYDVVYGKRVRRDGETWLKKTTASAFYRVMKHVGDVQLPRDTGDFRLLSRRAVNALSKLRERHRFMKGLFTWIGFKQTAILYDRKPRHAGYTKWNYWKLWNFAIDGITSFTIAPLKAAMYLGFMTSLFSFLFGLFIIAKTILFGRIVPGYASIMTVILFLSGVQLVALGLLGEYVGRTFLEVKGRPLYFIQEYQPPQASRALVSRVNVESFVKL
ncbi:glycosyltransferase family 2 protein [Petrachloros mirabilis]